MPILLQISKITFEKGENLKKNKNHISQNLAKILTENCCCCFVLFLFFHGFLISPRKKKYLKISRKIHLNCITKS